MHEGDTLTLAQRAARLAPRRIKVTVVAGPDVGGSVAGEVAVVGRARQADLRLTDPSVSSFHAELRATGDGVSVHDLESRNGTSFEGARLERAVVPLGAVLTLGSTAIRVEHEDAAGDAPRTMLASFGPMLGASSAMQALFAWLARLASTDLALLIEGPPGSGKETAARAVHAASRVAEGPFVVLDCVAMPIAMQDELFEGDNGVLAAAQGGTLFLDDVSELDLAAQGRLERALERTPRPRVIAASKGALRAAVNQGRFREDLYVRIAQARAAIPALAERPEDVSMLALHFVQALPQEVHAARRIAPEAMEELARREYRGDVRELRAVVERAAMIATGATITAADLAFERVLSTRHDKAGGGEVEAFKEAKRSVVDDFERRYLEALLRRVGDNLSRASIVSGVERHHLRELLRKHGLRSK